MASKMKRLSLEDRQAICEESFKPLIQPLHLFRFSHVMQA